MTDDLFSHAESDPAESDPGQSLSDALDDALKDAPTRKKAKAGADTRSADKAESTDKAANDDKAEMPFLDHLIELRTRLIRSCMAILAGMVIGFLFAEDIYAFLVQPLADTMGEGRRMIYTGLTEALFVYLKVSFYSGLALAFPYIAYQGYRFVAPGLYAQEKHAVLPYMLASPVLFLAGAALAYYGVFPMAWEFFLSFETSGVGQLPPIELEAKISEYLTLVIQLIFAFGLAFQLPVVLMLAVRAGLVTVEGLRKGRKYALVGVVTAGALFTPPDMISQIALAIPLMLLYEAAILLSVFIARKKADAAGG